MEPSTPSDTDTNKNTTTVKATCLCGNISHTLPPDTHLPLENVATCHCSDCRYVTGALYLASPLLAVTSPPQQQQEPPMKQDVLDRCVAYDSSGIRRRFFCGRCGAHMFIQEIGAGTRGRWWVMGGVLEEEEEEEEQQQRGGDGIESGRRRINTVKIDNHIFVTDTGDGGLVPQLFSLGGREVKAWERREGSSRLVDAAELIDLMVQSSKRVEEERQTRTNANANNRLLSAQCHCGGVSLQITRPDFDHDTQGVPARYVPPEKEDRDKYVAGLCVCRSCRLSLGVSFQPWTYVPPSNVRYAGTGEEVRFGDRAEGDFSPGSGSNANANAGTKTTRTLRHFWSSKDTCRSFCGKCGATIFYWTKQRPEVVDVSVGILRSDDGTMARSWLSWREGGPSSREECVDDEILQAVSPDS